MDTWREMGLIMYSRYYGAMSDKQHGDGSFMEKGFLQSKIDCGVKLLNHYGGDNIELLKLLLTVDSLASTPFGIGGKNVLTEKYGYNKKSVTQKIINEVGLSPFVIACFESDEFVCFESHVLQLLCQKLPIDKINYISKQFTDDLLDALINKSSKINGTINDLIVFNDERMARISEQEEDMLYVINILERNGVPGGGDPLMYLLGTKEKDFAKRKKQNITTTQQPSATPTVPIKPIINDTDSDDKKETPADEFKYMYSQVLQGIIIFEHTGESTNIRMPQMIDGENVVRIGGFHEGLKNRVFSDTGILSVHIPNSVIEIGNGAFSGCTELTSVTLPNNLKIINIGTFFNCANLIDITIPESVNEIGTAAFKNCVKLTNLVIPDSVTKIGFGALDGCIGLESRIDAIANKGTLAENIKSKSNHFLQEGMGTNMPKKNKSELAIRELREIILNLNNSRNKNKYQTKYLANKALNIISTLNHKGVLTEIIKSKSNLLFYEAGRPPSQSECTCGYRVSASGGCSCDTEGFEGYTIDLRTAARSRLLEL